MINILYNKEEARVAPEKWTLLPPASPINARVITNKEVVMHPNRQRKTKGNEIISDENGILTIDVSTPTHPEKHMTINSEDWSSLQDAGAGHVHCHRSRNTFYAQCWMGNSIGKMDVHKFILKGSEYTDHADRNGLNNERSNLRECTGSQNSINRIHPTQRSKSGYRGVHATGEKDKWHVEIKVRGTRHRVGRFSDVKEAALAYNEAAIKYHGEFAILNEVQ